MHSIAIETANALRTDRTNKIPYELIQNIHRFL